MKVHVGIRGWVQAKSQGSQERALIICETQVMGMISTNLERCLKLKKTKS
jgi:hypothetical protein